VPSLGLLAYMFSPRIHQYSVSNSAIRYRQMAGALASQTRPIQFELCIWGQAQVWTWGARVVRVNPLAADYC
jgi:hypothetical protein